MQLRDYVRFSVQQLVQRKGRTVLTSTGVMVGVFALTTIIAVAQGLEVAIVQELTDDESQTQIMVRSGYGPMPERDAQIEGVDDPAKADRLRKSISKRNRGGPGGRRRKKLTPKALGSLEQIDGVAAARPIVLDSFHAVLADEEDAASEDGASEDGAPEDGAEERELPTLLSFGVPVDDAGWRARVILGDELHDARGVWLHEYLLYTWGYRSDAEQETVVGRTLTLSRPDLKEQAQAFMSMGGGAGVDLSDAPPMAQGLLRMFGERLENSEDLLTVEVPVLGVIRERIESDGFDVWEDSFSMQADLFFPQGMAEELFGQVPMNQARGHSAVALEVESLEKVKPVEDALREEGYRTMSVSTILERVGRALTLITAFVSGLTMIALLVAVLGIMNTMIMNVSERTREIGTLKALGATDRQVRRLFLFESGLIGLLGGVSGIALALLGSYPGDYLTRTKILDATQYTWDGSIFRFPPWLLILALVFAVGLSVLAAWIPSRRASRIDPVVALRDE